MSDKEYDKMISPEATKFLMMLDCRMDRFRASPISTNSKEAVHALCFMNQNRIRTAVNHQHLVERISAEGIDISWIDHPAAFITDDKAIVLTAIVYGLNLHQIEAIQQAAHFLGASVQLDSWLSWWASGKTILIALTIPH